MTIDDIDERTVLDVPDEFNQKLMQLPNKYIVCKRFFDLILSLIIFIPSAIFVLFFGLLIIIETDGGMFYKQKRIGKYGNTFTIYKLRSMIVDVENLGKQYTLAEDSRITKIGKFVRKTRIDELPQIINVLMGDMSFIGPRPLTQYEYEITDSNFKMRTLVTPGISGLAQINGGNDLNNDKKLEFDLQYIDNLCMTLDLKILLKTIIIIFNGDGAR